ncbi:MAG TPA: HPr kinase/phosphatase C-terminal domain-containing protein [Beijerinckiaceae bacterium]|nr:HPr kinase/phosphatase C-terminal domain-containing protein [Beijerinckiaceae bacterium]
MSTVHASCVLIGEAGILIRGPSGSGKSRLACDLLAEAAARGRFARLVGDDRIALQPHGSRLVARGVAAIAGLVEVRGIGLVPAPHETAAVVRLLVECEPARRDRLPPDEPATVLLGVALPTMRLHVEGGSARPVLARLAAFESAGTVP